MSRDRNRAQGVGTGAASYDVDAQAYFDAVSLTDAVYTVPINQFVLDLKAASIWIKFDRLWLLASKDAAAALTCLKSLSVATPVNAPTFTSGRGYTFDGSTNYINSGYAPAVHGVQYALNSAHIGVWARTYSIAGDMFSAVGGDGVNIYNDGGVPRLLYGVNVPWITNNVVTAGNTGYFLLSRTATNLVTPYENATALAVATTAAGGLTSRMLFIGARNVGAADRFYGGQISLVHAGAGLDGAETAAVDAAVDVLKAAIGF